MSLHPALLAEKYDALSTRCATLEAENADLKRSLGLERECRRNLALCERWRFTGRESDLVLALYATRGRLLSKSALMDTLYQEGPDEPEIKIIDVWACKIRRKTSYDFIETVWGKGYRLSASGVALVAEILGDLA